MHFALYRLPLLVPDIQAYQGCGYLRRTLFSTSTHRLGAAFVARRINMATPKESASRLSVQLKTPKGTRDWFGADVILRDHILFVLVKVENLISASFIDSS